MRTRPYLAILIVLVMSAAAHAQPRAGAARLDSALRARARLITGSSRVIVTFRGAPDVRAITGQGGVAGAQLPLLGLQVAEVANARLDSLASDPRVARVSIDRPAFATLQRTALATGASYSRDTVGLTGAGVGVALIDSGISGWHDDLNVERGANGSVYAPRVLHFKDFTSPYGTGYHSEFPFDDYGHGTHVAGIIAGSGYDSDGARIGIAPKARLIGLKVLDANGAGYVSAVIAAIDYAIAMKDALNIRVINLSVGAGVYESHDTDPLAQAARRAVDAGIVVVAASGNFGRDAKGTAQYGGVTSPGNAPWVLTVGASTHNGTTRRGDDTIGGFSSRGPSAIDFAAKPDLVAPGVGIESLAEPWTTLYDRYSDYLLPGTSGWSWYSPYLSLSGTSMAAPVVTGTIALMLEANPSLTPNAVKAILQYTAQSRSAHDFLTQGAGFLNTRGAVRLARYWANPQAGLGAMSDYIGGERVPWGRHLIWGNYRVGGGVPMPGANAWALGLTWGATEAPAGEEIVWGAESLDNIVWGLIAENIVWGLLDENIVWSLHDNVVRSLVAENIVWSLQNAENIVWGLDCGGGNCANVVWGQRAPDGSLWGTVDEGERIVWPTADDNIVWGMLADNIVWGLSAVEPTVWRER